MNKKINIFLSHALIENDNKGCVALTYSSIFLIDRILKRNGIEYNLFLNGPLNKTSLDIGDKKYSIRTFIHPLKVNFKSNPFKIFNKNILKGFFILYKTDIHFELSSGDSFSDIYGEKRFKFINRICKISRFLRKKYVYLPQTIGPFFNDKAKNEAIKNLENAHFIMTRDKKSFDIVSSLIADKKVNEYIDIAFLLPYTKWNINSNEFNIGLNISGLLWHGGYTKNNQFGLKDDYKKTIHSLVENLLKINNCKIHLIPHVYSVNKRDIENDYNVIEIIYKNFNSPQIVMSPLFFSPIEAKSYIAGMDFFIGSRMHSTIAAFSSGVPVVPLAYSRKFEGMFKDTLIYPYMLDLKKDTTHEVIKKIFEFLKTRDEIKTIVDDRLDTIVKPRLEKLENDLENILLNIADR